jgi:hypothetical protein
MPLFQAATISSVVMSRLSVSLRFTDQRSTPRDPASSGASGTSEYAGAFSLSETAPLPFSGLPSRAMPSTTIGLLQPLQRIFTRLPRTLSSLMVYFEPQDSQVTFMFFLNLREVAAAATPGYPRQIERIPNFDPRPNLRLPGERTPSLARV